MEKNKALLASFSVSVGGVLFGYHAAIIAGALLFLSKEFHLSSLQQGLVVSTFLMGAIFGSVGGGSFADAWGRKRSLMLSCLLFFIGTFLQGQATSVNYVLFGRCIAGIGVGISSSVIPLYIAEIAPSAKRGGYTLINQIAIGIGGLIANWVAYRYARGGDWRAMISFAYIPALFQGATFFWIPETPAWIAYHQQRDKKSEPEKERNASLIRKSLIIGIGISAFQQLTGINIFTYYAPHILKLAGYASEEHAIFGSFLLGWIGPLVTLSSLWLIDRWGRRPLLLMGALGMCLSLATLSFAFYSGLRMEKVLAPLSLGCFSTFFVLGFGTITGLIISEVFPLSIRGKAVGVASAVNWICNYVASLLFFPLIDWMGAAGLFALYALICLISSWFVYAKVPETKGKTLEEIERALSKTV